MFQDFDLTLGGGQEMGILIDHFFYLATSLNVKSLHANFQRKSELDRKALSNNEKPSSIALSMHLYAKG